MKFSPQTKTLYTESGERIKTLFCPLRLHWEQLHPQTASPHRTCAACERSVLDTAQLTEAEVVAAVRADPTVCLCVSARQENVTLVFEDIQQ